MKLVPELTAEAVGPTVTRGVVATVVVATVVVDQGEENSEDINLYYSYLYP